MSEDQNLPMEIILARMSVSEFHSRMCLIHGEMRDRMERFIVLPFSIRCVSESSIAVIEDRQKKPLSTTDRSTQQKDETYREEKDENLEGGQEKRVKNSSGFLSLQRQNTTAVLQKLLKSFRDLTAQIFSNKEEEEEEEEMEIGFPTDVQHVGHIGWDGSNKAPQLLSLPSISFREFEFAMVDQEDCNGRRNLVA